jgi:hypothetical protein
VRALYNNRIDDGSSVWSTNSESLVLRRKAICDLTPEEVVVGVGSFDFAVLCDFKRDGALHAF